MTCDQVHYMISHFVPQVEKCHLFIHLYLTGVQILMEEVIKSFQAWPSLGKTVGRSNFVRKLQ